MRKKTSSTSSGSLEIMNEQQDIDEPATPSPLPAVRRAIEEIPPGARRVRIERRPQRMTVELNGTRLDVAQLSDGEKCLFAMAEISRGAWPSQRRSYPTRSRAPRSS